MQIRRRAVIAMAIAAPCAARAQGEARRIIVPFPPGGSGDGIARLLADRAQRDGLGTVMVENRPGAAGSIGAAAAARARPDGRTLLLTLDTVLTVNPHVQRDPGFDTEAGLVPVALIASFPLVLLVYPGSGIADLPALLATARRQPIFYASAGIGAPGHLAMEHLRQTAGLPADAFEHVPLRGNPEALQAIVAGTVPAGFLAIGGGPDLVRTGRLRAIAVSGPTRLAMLPDVPTVAELGHAGFDVRIALVLYVPRGTPSDAIAEATRLLEATLATPEASARLAGWGLDREAGDGAAAAGWIAAGRQRWGAVVRAAGMRAE